MTLSECVRKRAAAVAGYFRYFRFRFSEGNGARAINPCHAATTSREPTSDRSLLIIALLFSSVTGRSLITVVRYMSIVREKA